MMCDVVCAGMCDVVCRCVGVCVCGGGVQRIGPRFLQERFQSATACRCGSHSCPSHVQSSPHKPNILLQLFLSKLRSSL